MKKEQARESKFMSDLTNPQRFKIMEDGWIQDAATGLEWGPSSENYMTLKEAEKYCAKAGGRLPDVHELHSLVDFTQEEPAINKEIFKDTKSSYYWTRTRTAWNKNAAWCVSFFYGYVDSDNEGNGNYVRPVRVSQ